MKKKAMLMIMAAMLMFSALPIGVNAADTNVALGKSYTIETHIANEYSYVTEEKGSKDQLTDGKKAPNPIAYYSGDWAHFVRAIGRTITIDLEKTYSISGYSMNFLQNAEHGVYCPAEVTIAVSGDGVNYMNVASKEKSIAHDHSGVTRVLYSDTLDKTYKARYVRVIFDVDVNSFLDEIEIFGGDVTGNEAAFVKTPARLPENNFGGRDSAGGYYDLVGIHVGYEGTNDPKTVYNTKESFMPYVGYRNASGKYSDTLFDGFVFFNLQGLAPSGGNLGILGDPSVLSDWEYLINNTFADGYNIPALNEAVSDLQETLDLPESYKVGVYLNIPFPKISDKVFNDIGADGVPSKIQTMEDMLKAQEWYLEQVEKRFAELNLKHIEYLGIFWCSESAENGRWNEFSQFTVKAVKMIQDRGSKVMFIPFYQATGIDRLDELGFDVTTMQPNLSFNAPLQINPSMMMQDFLQTCYQYGMGMEMEISHKYFNNADEKAFYGGIFLQYLQSASASPIMTEAVHTYYQVSGPGVFYTLANSSDTYDRYIYDCLYKFIKGTLSFPAYEVITTKAQVRESLPSLCRVEIKGDWLPSDFDYQIVENASKGNVVLVGKDGAFRYTPSEDFDGEDSFVIRVTRDDFVDERTIYLTVEEVEPDESSSDEFIIEKRPFTESPWFFSTICFAIGIVTLTAGLILRRKNKKNEK